MARLRRRLSLRTERAGSEGAYLLLSAFGGRDADDAGELIGGEEMTELDDDKGGGGAGAEAEDHARLDVLHGLVGGKLLEVVLREGSGRGGLTVRKRGCVLLLECVS
ncbi:hypothetical protein HN51_011804 [Arachis hypogaea]